LASNKVEAKDEGLGSVSDKEIAEAKV